MFPANLPISTEKIVRNDILRPVSLTLQDKKTEIEINMAEEIASAIESNMRLLDKVRIPDHFDRGTLGKFFEKMIREDFETDPLQKESARIGKYANDFHHYMLRYFKEVFDFNEGLKKDRMGYVQATSYIYLRSDFPPSFARTVALSLLSECRFIDIYNRRIKREYSRFLSSYNDQTKFKRLCNAHNLWVGSVDSLINEIDNIRVGLIWYVEFTQSKKVEDLFKPKPLKKSLLDQEYFFGVLINLQKKTEQLRHELVSLSRESFSESLSREDPTVAMLCGILDTMGS
jgi:hypothetical protein